jgi:hypothetical protein
MTESPFSAAFVQWASLAHNELAERDDAWVLAEGGWETLTYLRSADGLFMLTNTQRGGPEEDSGAGGSGRASSR